MIIGICGFESSGKDTVAEYLIKEYGFKRLSFASTIKDIVSIMFNWPRDKLEGLTKEDREWREQIDPWWSESLKMPYLSPRYVLRYFGTDLFRAHFHPNIWVKIIENKLNKYNNIVISDCRFKNEINMLLKYGGKIIQVHRNMPKWFYNFRQGEDVDEIKQLHISETEWIRCHNDYELTNDGTIEELHNNVKYIMNKTA
jgi:hypothetical protein